MIPWRQVLHNHLVEALSNNRAFQKFAQTTDQKISELSGKSAKRATELQEDMANPEALEETKAKVMTFLEEFRKELGEGVDKSFRGKR
ncbi:hypothetical protein HDU89_006932 [Geranomyces variabilis]|nr:hypothetical protein BDZ88DRAFT_414497 [Geranomyces variabilis]KAJ3141027.1 hypothetical protein HDU90_007050 [Geranomyces variabilis]KAJ3145697.1 hypothetical protein HDU89_006932 [Geranomyces variabilis]KAJ3171221.1 hypothetical protein HDU88_008258 [Geranomyces variabilis]